MRRADIHHEEFRPKEPLKSRLSGLTIMLGRLTLASWMVAGAIDVRCPFHCLALNAAVLA